MAQEKTEEFETVQGVEKPGKNKAMEAGQYFDFFEHEAGTFNTIGPKAREIIEQDCKITSACTARPYPLVVDSAKGSVIRDVDGREYIDLVAGIAVMNAGYSNSEVKAAILSQLEKMTHCGYGDFFAEPPVKLAKKLEDLSGYSKVFYCNSGTEAVEAAIKLAFWKTKRQGLISFYNSFHGRTLGSLSLTCSKARQKEHFPVLHTAHSHYAYCYRCPFKLEYPSCGIECAKELENLIFRRELSPTDTAAVFVEPVQGEGGYIVPPPEFHKEVRRICTDNDVLLVADEVQAGCFRTGPFLAMENFGVKAEISCFAKALGGGLPLGAILADRELMDWPQGVHSNTFGGNLLASAASFASLEFLEKENIEHRVKELGSQMKQRLRELQENFPCIGDVRGLGLMVGVEIVKPDKSIDPIRRDRILREAFKEGILLLPCGDSVIRFSPPLVITDEELDSGIEKFQKAMKKAGS
ncbi:MULTISPECIES: aspartate aminotransferase family protein [Methanosarcina]|uniref:4-aminobutyrate aminotransferase n=3 Tax=Methanosarcina barkeri TaxID=2208 RepID=A0A0E3QUC0_METBA|nr:MULTISPECIES: aspartate aminotransferase family protein [Methanosarcina]AKB54235.1 4-aminobutyrate aminotransferase [Methanosarcina barkeri MS]AKB57689.1 4-aminobutyrate aminotransferase [Methanosarcina barkeri 227]AKJ38236.1 aminotransferase [Methanosarcina barkeri CM1]